MANLSYNKKQTALIKGGRSVTVQPDKGDLFIGVWDYTTVTEYNALVDWYLQTELDIEAAHAGSFTVTGLNENNEQVEIDDEPARPFPIRKPT